MKLGIVGLPNVGKSTLFNAITNAGAQSANYAFCTIEPNVGTVAVPDERIDKLAEMYDPDKTTHASIEFVDIAGLVKGASKGEGLGNKFLSHIREVDAIINVVRCFEGTDIIHVDGSIDPIRDIETIEFELIFSDIEMAQRRMEKANKSAKSDKKLAEDAEFLKRIISHLEAGKPARSVECSDIEAEILQTYMLITAKPVIYACNLSEDDFSAGIDKNKNYESVKTLAEKENAVAIAICAELESQLSEMTVEEKHEFLSEIGVQNSGLDQLIKGSYALLGLISYLTAGKQEVRAWTITKGTKAPGAAGKIHTDFERGFIRAEIVAYDDLLACGNMVQAKEKGLVRSEGKEYVVKDGDIVLFRFNV